MAYIGDVPISKNSIKIMGIVNVSPESFYKKSIKTSIDEISSYAKKLENDGADIIDIGAMSTAPYLDTMISLDDEIVRLTKAIKIIKENCKLPISVDTPRSIVAEEAIKMGAHAINDVCGLKYDHKMAEITSKYNIPIIIGAYEKNSHKLLKGKSFSTKKILSDSITIAQKAGIKKTNIIIDPSIGFFRNESNNPFFTKITKIPWYLRDIEIVSNLKELSTLSLPICISVSNKSFLGKLLNLTIDERLIPSLIMEVIAIINGATLIRTHNVKETMLALNTLQLIY
ncbi:MAG TPA: dihydropteroate synthase [Nitrososphaeraceae archaeon]|jgi:dihydropteroate synthase|nr:dihydropteroate synthase [Nitrososphaeraceae archaeon]